MEMTERDERDFSDEFRQEVFQALVATQDEGMSVKESRRDVAQRFGLTTQQVERIEREGIDKTWPPLAGDDEPAMVLKFPGVD
jgi:transposase-like protein